MEEEKPTFDEIAKDYDEMSGSNEMSQWIADSIIESKVLTKETKLLDFGCGTGRGSMKLIEHVDTIVGSDVSSEMLKKFKEKFDEKKLNIKLIHTSKFPKELIDENSTFDVILFSLVLHHIEEYEKIFTEVTKLLNKNGVIVVVEFKNHHHHHHHHHSKDDEEHHHHKGDEKCEHHHEHKGNHSSEVSKKDIKHNFTQKSMLDLFEKNNFKVVSEKNEKFQFEVIGEMDALILFAQQK